MIKTKPLKINSMLVNTENYRFEAVTSQKEAINQMIEDQGENLFNLAENILSIGLNPYDPIYVVKSNHERNKFIVLEGNRRTVAMKLVHNPDLVEKNAKLKKRFKKLHDTLLAKLPATIECVLYDDAKDADVWIGIKHGYDKSGTGTDGWDPLQKDRFAEKTQGKTSTAIQLINLIKAAPDVPQDIKDNVKDVSMTNLNRLISDPTVRDFVGIDIVGGVLKVKINEKEALKGLSYIVKDLLSPNFTVKKIYTKEDRKDYIDKFPKSSIPNKSIPLVQAVPVAPTPVPHVTPAPLPTPKPKPNPTDRKNLIPKSCILTITNPKVNAIYHELGSLDISKHKNAVAVLLRVFIELSVDSYIDEHLAKAGSSSTRSGDSLQKKINEVTQHLEVKKLADSAICKGMRDSAKDKNGILGIETWHAYVHNNLFSPLPQNLIITWDNIQAFMIILHQNIK